MAWKDLTTGEIIKWDAAKKIEGAYVGGEEQTTDYGENTVHTIEQPDGTRVSFFGTAQLNGALKQVATGQLVRIEYTGQTRKTKRGFNVKAFVIQAWERESPE